MTTEHQDDQRRSGGFREAVNELFGRNEHDSRDTSHDSRDTSQLDALDRDEARRQDDVDPAAERHAYGDQAAVAQPGEARLDDPAGQTTPGGRYEAGAADARMDDTATARHGDPLADDAAARENIRFDDGVVDDRPGTDPRAQEQHLGETRTPHGGEVRGDTVAPEHVRQGGDPTAQGQVQHGGELRGDTVGTRSDADLDTGPSVRDTGATSGADLDAGAHPRDADGASTPGVGAGAAASAAGAAHHDSSADGDEERAALVTRDRAESYSARWDSVKGEFVDEPRRAVADADALVGELLDELQELFKQQRTQIEQGLDADETSTEDLRLALRRYRSFFDRLLSI